MIDEPTARALALLIAALGIPALLVSLGRSLWKWWTGRAGRERMQNKTLIEERDQADRDRRKALEYASLLRRQLNEAGVRPLAWPDGLDARPRTPRRRAAPNKENE